VKKRTVLVKFHGNCATGENIYVVEFYGENCEMFGAWPFPFVQLAEAIENWILLGKRPN